MKFGLRKPNLKSRVKARTTGKMKRKAKSAVNPFYGKKGSGLRNPKRAAYNKVYNKTTKGCLIPLISIFMILVLLFLVDYIMNLATLKKA